MQFHGTNGARIMQAHIQEEIDSSTEPNPMAIIGAILAQGAIRFLDRQKREQMIAQKSSKVAASPLSTGPGSTLPPP